MSQSVFSYNGVEYEFETFDADCAEKLEEAMGGLKKAEQNIPKTGSISVLVKAQCKMLRDFFDTIFGAGAGTKICGEKDSFNNCKNAYVSFLGFVDEQKQDYVSNMNGIREKYSANRAQRRHPATAKAPNPHYKK